MCSRRLLSLGGSLAVTMFLASSAFAQLDKDAQKCIDGYNNKLRLVSAQAGKSARSCIKNANKGSVPDADVCIVTNTDGKIAGKEAKVTDLYTAGKCTGTEPIQQGAVAGNAAHRNGITDFAHELYGDPVGPISTDKGDAKCLDKGIQRSTQAITEIIKAHRSCMKNGMKALTVFDEASADAVCGTFAQIDSGGKAAGKLAKVTADVTANCGTTTSGIAALYDGLPGSCHATAGALAACLVQQSRCAACLILNEADGQDIDCDIFDDTVANASCGGYPAINLGTHTCTLGAGTALNLGTQALPLNLSPTGTIDIACGTTTPDGKAACTCDITSISTLVIPAIGDVCVNPVTCPAGEIDCDGGNSLDVDVIANHNIGACTDDADCSADCDAECASLGATYDKIAYGCEGFCQGGANDNDPCTLDSQCTGGSCTGADPVAHGGSCQCTCQGTGLGGASAPGSLSCNVGTQIDVELPSDGDCLDANTITLAPICGAVTSTTATGGVMNANNTGAKTIPPIGMTGTFPNTETGLPLDCNTFAGSSTSGLRMVGHLGFYDSILGDIFSENIFSCN